MEALPAVVKNQAQGRGIIVPDPESHDPFAGIHGSAIRDLAPFAQLIFAVNGTHSLPDNCSAGGESGYPPFITFCKASQDCLKFKLS